jgi:hypothetical protein
MPTTARIVCPGCGAALRATLSAAARTVRCPKCSEAVPVPAEGAETKDEAKTAVPPVEEKKPRPPSEDEPDESESDEEAEFVTPVDPSRTWRTVRLGLLLILFSVGGQAVVALVGIVVGCLLQSAIFAIFTGGLSAACRVTGIAGIALLTFAPDVYAPRKLLYTALAVISLSTLYGIFNDFQSYLHLAKYSNLTSTEGIKKAQDEAIKKIEEDAKRRAKMTPEERKKELEKMVEDSKRQVEEITSAARRSPLWTLPLTIFTSIASILLPLYYRQLAESLKEPETVERCESLIKYKLIVIAIGLISELVTIAMFLAGPSFLRSIGPLMMVFGLVGIVVLVLGILCFVLEIQIVLGLRQTLTGKAAVRRKRKKKRRRD